MNVYITKLNGMSFTSTEQYAQHMAADIAHSLGIREMGIYRYYAEAESTENRTRRFDGIIAGINVGDIVICQFPTWNGLSFERALVRHIKAYHGRIIIFIHDVEALMSDTHHKDLQDTVELYNEAEVLIVPSLGMRMFLTEHGIRTGMKFVIQEMWDYTALPGTLGSGTWNREIHFAGNPDGIHFPNAWEWEVPLKVYSDSECHGTHVRKMGWLAPERLLMELAKGGFGLVWYGNEEWRRYLSVNNSLKLGVYFAAGIPVIVPRGISSRSIIEENHLGIAADTLEEAAEAIKKMTETDYQVYSAAAAQFAPLVREGFFTKKCLLDAIHMSVRNDMYTYSESNETYRMSECTFAYVCLKESYKNNLALSWAFQGEAEGFLIYDADSGKAAGEISNVLEHYFLLEDYPKTARFIVKAYVRTLKGKMILAESGAAAVSEMLPIKPVVSLIMPAYNAEEYIARSIDTALAQSFPDMELIIVNDGSTDETQAVLDWYRERYPQVKTFYKENGGQAAARNMGIEKAEGNYIAFMDNDDTLRPDMIERLYATIVKNDCDIAMTSVYMLTGERYEDMTSYPMIEDTAVSIEVFFEYYMRNLSPVLWNKLYRASLVKEHPCAVRVTFEDDAWTPYVLSYADRVCYINAHLYEYDRSRGSTAIHASWNRPVEEKFLDHRELVLFFLENGNQERKDLLKKLALVYVSAFPYSASYVGYSELRKEIEQM
ncbi:glycosyltransferase [Candidatus Merdisoma sp. JLR.KK011]|uniref:glycosyltransferase n=1 Tax=Candidatus Merdisoma sp. JLR.KK011 TaxID=3114299 RepID=UPI002FF3E683